MKNADMPAMPCEVQVDFNACNQARALGRHVPPSITYQGMTKREMMATSIISGCLAGGHFVGKDVELIPSLAVILTDKLLEELEKTGGKQQWNTKLMPSKF